jgi:6-phosphogluconolactonase
MEVLPTSWAASMRAWGIVLIGAALTLIVIASPSFAATVGSTPAASGGASAVFTMTNAPTGNQIVVFERASSGALTWVGNFSTGGYGTGASLADQGSLALTSDHRFLLAVDAGSDQISVLRIGTSGGQPSLRLTDTVASGGVLPVSLTVAGTLVYVLNDGSTVSPGNIAGFTLSPSGLLHPLAGSTQPLSTTNATGAAQIAFNPAGTLLAVTEKATSLIDIYPVSAKGVALAGTTHASQGVTPYGFAFSPRGALIVSEAVTGSLSSYGVGPHGRWQVLSSSVTDLESAPCWVVVTPGGAYAYTTNAASDSISSYAVGAGGHLALLQAVAAVTGATPTDLALTPHGHLLYVYDAGAGEVEGYQVHADGTLSWVTSSGGLPAGDVGLVAS